MEIKASCINDLKAITALNRASLIKRKTNPKIMIILWSILTFAYVFSAVWQTIVFGKQTILLILTAVVVFLELFLLYGYFISPKKQYKVMAKTANTQNNYIFTEESFSISSNNDVFEGNSKIDYSALILTKETKEYIFLYVRKNLAYIVDKKTIEGGTVEALRNVLSKNLNKNYIICNY